MSQKPKEGDPIFKGTFGKQFLAMLNRLQALDNKRIEVETLAKVTKCV